MSLKSSKGTCDSLSSHVPTRDNCLMYLCSMRSGGPHQGRWQGQWFLFMWAAASMLILNTGGERDSQQEGGRIAADMSNWEDWWLPSLLFPNASAWGQRWRSRCAGDSKIHSTVSALLQCWLMRPKWHRKQAVLREENSQAFLSLMILTKRFPQTIRFEVEEPVVRGMQGKVWSRGLVTKYIHLLTTWLQVCHTFLFSIYFAGKFHKVLNMVSAYLTLKELQNTQLQTIHPV